MKKTVLVNQPSSAPTRKWWAGAIAGAAVNAAYGVMESLWPDHPFAPYKAEIIGYVTMGVMLIVQYFTRNRGPNVGL